LNPKVRVLLTVSPVPLVATFQNKHVLTATVEAKSALRAVASFLTKRHAWVDYFPSYEMISTFPYRGIFYEPDLRSVTQSGVDYVMDSFFKSTNIGENAPRARNAKSEVVCEQVLLDAFGGKQ